MKIIPAIDIIAAKTVRLEEGKYDKEISYDLSPIEAARKWENAGARMLHVVDLDGARAGRPVNFALIEEIARAVNVPVEAGGGFRKEVDIKRALNAGVFRVIVGSKVFEDIDFARAVINDFGQRVIVSVDAGSSSKARMYGWEKESGFSVADITEKLREFGAKEFIYTDVAKDGTLEGPDIRFLRSVLAKSGMNVIYAGGIGEMAHIEELMQLGRLGLEGIIIGRALYDGAIDLKEAIDEFGQEDNPVS